MEAIHLERSSAGARPDLDVSLPDWYEQAACFGMDTETFFDSPGQGKRPTAALAVCLRCPVVDPCRDYALADASLYGVWGGTSETERTRLRRERQAS